MASSRLERIGTIFTSVSNNNTMAPGKKTLKTKLPVDASPKDASKEKKTEKRQRNDPAEEENDDIFMAKLISQFQTNVKKMKVDPETEAADIRKKILDLFSEQHQARKQYKENIFKNLSEVTFQVEADYNIMKENEQRMEQLAGSFMKCLRQATLACKQKLKALNEIESFYRNQVEGLLARGAMKPDDRPVWFDVYKAFPPLVEPKFARPKPEITPIKQIFYKEDLIRAEFHTKGHGKGAVNLLAQSNDTQTKRLVQQYEKLKAEGVPEEELIEKSATAAGVERKDQYEAAITKETKSAKATPENPNSVTAQVLAEADLKNIFKE